MKNKLLQIIIVAAIVGAAAFYGGMKYGQSKPSVGGGQNFSRQMAGSGTGLGIGNRQGQGFIAGEIIAKDSQSITVKLLDGSSKIVFYSGSTEVGKSVSGTSNDLETGKTVNINGTTNSDGSITAKSIQIRTK